MIWATALMLVVAGMTVSSTEAEAGLFNRRNNDCCKPARQPRCGRRAKKQCCEPVSVCAPAPTCCEPVSVCAAPAPSCGCETAAPVMYQSAPVADCGCSAAVAAPSCGCEAAPACGCEVANCDCLNRRQLRRANRKGECCGAEANSCNTCSTCATAGCSTCGSAVQTASYEVSAPVVQGCSTCGASAGTIIESGSSIQGCSSCGQGTVIESSSPTPAAGEEAAPEAPESTT